MRSAVRIRPWAYKMQKEEHYIEVEFKRSFRMRKQFKPLEDDVPTIRIELAKALKEWVIYGLTQMTLKDFKTLCCNFHMYADYEEEETKNGIIKGPGRVYY